MALYQPGESGNPNGRPKGATSKVSRVAKALVSDNAVPILSKGIQMALDGDQKLLVFFLERLIPKRIITDIKLKLADTSYKDQIQQIFNQIEEEELDNEEASLLLELLSKATKIEEFSDLKERLEKLEELQNG